MADRATWVGVLGFGMVNIPIKLYTTIKEQDIKFNQLHNTCHTRISQIRSCNKCITVLATEDIERGYERSPGKFVVVSDDHLASLETTTKKLLNIEYFCKSSEISPALYEKSYYMIPEKAPSEKAFNLLHKTINGSGVVGIGKINLTGKEKLCSIRVQNGILLLTTLFAKDEVKEPIPVKETEVAEQEIKMAKGFVKGLIKPFVLESLTDKYREQLFTLINGLEEVGV